MFVIHSLSTVSQQTKSVTMKITCFAVVTLSAVLDLAFADGLWNNNNNFNNDFNNNNDDGFYRNPLVSQAGSVGMGGGASYYPSGSGYGKGYGSGSYGYGHATYVPLPAVQGKSESGFGGLTTLLLLFILFPFFFNKQNDNKFIFLNTTK